MKCKNCPMLKNVMEGCVIVENYCKLEVLENNKFEFNEKNECKRILQEINQFIKDNESILDLED